MLCARAARPVEGLLPEAPFYRGSNARKLQGNDLKRTKGGQRPRVAAWLLCLITCSIRAGASA